MRDSVFYVVVLNFVDNNKRFRTVQTWVFILRILNVHVVPGNSLRSVCVFTIFA